MLLSRLFSLLVGTTMFVLIWSTQDGDHALPRVHAAGRVTHRYRIAIQPDVPHVAPQQVASQPVLKVDHDERALWMFADEPVERLAGK